MSTQCPFCGSNKTRVSATINEDIEIYKICCIACGASGPITMTEASATEKWEKRATPRSVYRITKWSNEFWTNDEGYQQEGRYVPYPNHPYIFLSVEAVQERVKELNKRDYDRRKSQHDQWNHPRWEREVKEFEVLKEAGLRHGEPPEAPVFFDDDDVYSYEEFHVHP